MWGDQLEADLIEKKVSNTSFSKWPFPSKGMCLINFPDSFIQQQQKSKFTTKASLLSTLGDSVTKTVAAAACSHLVAVFRDIVGSELRTSVKI